MRLTTPPCFKCRSASRHEVYAIQALEKGEATPYQQQQVLNYILQELCAVYQVGFVPDSPDQSNYLQGRQFPGQQLFKYMRLGISFSLGSPLAKEYHGRSRGAMGVLRGCYGRPRLGSPGVPPCKYADARLGLRNTSGIVHSADGSRTALTSPGNSSVITHIHASARSGDRSPL